VDKSVEKRIDALYGPVGAQLKQRLVDAGEDGRDLIMFHLERLESIQKYEPSLSDVLSPTLTPDERVELGRKLAADASVSLESNLVATLCPTFNEIAETIAPSQFHLKGGYRARFVFAHLAREFCDIQREVFKK